MDVADTCFAIFDLITFILYAMIMIYMACGLKKKLNANDMIAYLYIHIIVNGFIDIFFTIVHYMLVKLMKYNTFVYLYKEYPIIPRLLSCLYYPLFAGSILGGLIIVFTRFVALNWPVEFKYVGLTLILLINDSSQSEEDGQPYLF
uniref:Serpentine receptor class gamma n=1 Tax=Rhabditophanes sp. KR3021 TaxID=114890 RepID=A0AC35UAV8_9BILA